MLAPEIARRLDWLLAIREKGVFTEDEFADHIGALITADNINTLMDRLPRDLVGAVKKGILFDSQQVVDNEYLQPEASPFDRVQISDQYYRNVAEALLEPDQPKRQGLLSVICLPSFQVEWALRLIGSEKMGYFLVLRVAATQIWSAHATSPIAVNQLETPLPAGLAVLVGGVWRKMVQRVRHPKNMRFGMDGVRYHFSCRGLETGWMAGQIRSPKSQTAPGKLVALSHLLYRYVEQDESKREVLESEIRQAAEWFSSLA